MLPLSSLRSRPRSSRPALAGALAATALAFAAACGRAPPPAPPIGGGGPREAAAGDPAAADAVMALGADHLAARATWRACTRALASTDVDRSWADLDGFQRQQYLEGAGAIVAHARAVADELARRDDRRAAALAARADAVARVLDGADEVDDPPAAIGGEVERLLDDGRAAIVALAGAVAPPALGRCAAARLTLALAVQGSIEPLHRFAVLRGPAKPDLSIEATEEARVTAEMAVFETGLPPGSAEQAEVEAEHARLDDELDAWGRGLSEGDFLVAGAAELARLPAGLGPPAPVVPEPMADDWRALAALVAHARRACDAALPPPP